MRVMDATDKDMTYKKMSKIWLPMQLEPGKSTRDRPSVTKSVYTWFGLHPSVHKFTVQKPGNIKMRDVFLVGEEDDLEGGIQI